MGNIIKACFPGGSRSCITEQAYQYDYGQILLIKGVELPSTYEVHFSNSENGKAKTAIGGENGVLIPDEYFTTGDDIFAWVFLHDSEDDGETMYKVRIPVADRAEPSDEPPTPEEQSAITQAIAALNSAVETTSADVVAAEYSAQQAGESAQAAEQSAQSAHASAETAQDIADKLDDEIGQAVEDYLDHHPIEAPVTSVNAKTGAVVLDAADVGAISTDDLQTAVDEALAQAKASGEFDGPPGPAGEAGPKGDTGDTGPAGSTGPQGPAGETGPAGADGFSPSASVSKSGKVATITITDKNGTTTTTVSDGEDGQPGSTGPQGPAGHSPVVTASKSGKATTISVDGSPIATINDGDDGQPGSQGPKGDTGEAGHTPVKGTDYWTAADKAGIVQDVLDALDEAEGVGF